MKCFTQNRLHWINTSNSDNMEFKFKEPHKETRESMAKVASGENPYLNDRNNSFEKNCQKKVKEITGHEYCEITSSGNNSIFIALSAIEGSVIIPDQGGWNGFKQIANYLNSNIEDCTIDKKKSMHLKELTDPKQLALGVGELMTIKNYISHI